MSPSRSEASSEKKAVASTKRDAADKAPAKSGPFRAIGRFFKEVGSELRKVVTPTRRELFSFTGVVLVFVVFMMVLVTALDLLFGWGASWVFGTGTEVTWPDFGSIFGGTPAPTPAETPAP
ncbi:preprotein translocase subunit SecE [Pseudoclavibacter chungangensis]|uniref:Protein translocase subunit SecE n=1 Tax=Pseudoclavibacter chungangensis TaxID=587635 RepID=A0A7J5BT28_9MICO|nr:preprotein translocase subunit SecE [Pseudoclavibacter chungangensis]NYJ67839.1 preprotein translocase subunit SecE [Pseudoclavibacter chungangensis]